MRPVRGHDVQGRHVVYLDDFVAVRVALLRIFYRKFAGKRSRQSREGALRFGCGCLRRMPRNVVDLANAALRSRTATTLASARL
jgi:hypothetical protein